MTRVDLDLLEKSAQTFAPEGWVRTYVPPMIAELRAAREAIKDVRAAGHDGPTGERYHPVCQVCRAVGAFDQVAGT